MGTDTDMTARPTTWFAMLALLVAPGCKGADAEANQQMLQRRIEETLQKVKAEGDPWRQAMAKAIEAGLPPATGAACSAQPSDVEILRGWAWRAVKPAEIAQAASGREKMRAQALKRLSHELSNTHLRDLEDPAPFMAKVEEAARLGDGEVDVLIVIDALTEPKEVSRSGTSGSFQAGSLEGRIFVWSYPEGRVVCAGKVKATNSDEVTVGKYDNLMKDLQRNALTGGLKQARSIR
jgi:hypothetical protein